MLDPQKDVPERSGRKAAGLYERWHCLGWAGLLANGTYSLFWPLSSLECPMSAFSVV